jgi:hypothetical protein
MKELSVSLDITSPSLTLADLSSRLDRSPSSSSHCVGDPRLSPDATGKIGTETVWRLDSNVAKTASVEEHLNGLVAQLPPATVLRPGALSHDCAVRINIGVLYDSYTAGLSITHAALSMIHAYGAVLDISCYPTDFGQQRRPPGVSRL